ncbi:MAG: hypothetical protein H7X86_11825 [Gorillibacterium sp.]|nr:hypothetical protein [Gorillibacterium sp.]
MTDNNKQMPLYHHDQKAYIQQMYEWHQALAVKSGDEGVYHSMRASEYRSMLEEETTTSVDYMFY